MGKCVKCGAQFVGTPENPPADALCRYCEIQAVKAELDLRTRDLHASACDWETDFAHIGTACEKLGLVKWYLNELIPDDTRAIPHFTDMLVAELERVKEQVRWRNAREAPTERADYLVVWMVDGELRNEVEMWDGERWINFHSDTRTMVCWMPLPGKPVIVGSAPLPETPKGEGK